MSYSNYSCYSILEIVGSEYHKNIESSFPNTNFQILLHFLQKISSIIFIIVYIFYFLHKKKLIGLHRMYNETVFHYLDGIIEELIEETKECTTPYYHMALKLHKKKISKEVEEIDNNQFHHSEKISRSLTTNNFNSDFMNPNKNKQMPIPNFNRSKTNFNILVFLEKDSEELLNNTNKENKNQEFELKNSNNWRQTTENQFLNEENYFIEVNPDKIIKDVASNNSESRSKRRDLNLNPSLDIYRNFYICNLYECCCECCCDYWSQNIFKHLYSIYLNFKQKTFLFFILNSKKFCFYVIYVGIFFQIALRNTFSIFLSDCLQSKMGDYFLFLFGIFSLMDIFLGAIFFFSNVFLISFLSTRREFLAINPSNKQARGRIIYYHLNKGIIYGLLHLIFQLALKMIYFFKRPFYEVYEGSDTAIFSLLKFSFLFFFIVHNYTNWKRTGLIKEDCDILKFQNRYFAIQNTFLKFLPHQTNFLKFIKCYLKGKKVMPSSSSSFESFETPLATTSEIKKKQDFLKSFERDLEMHLRYVKLQLHEQLSIVERQKFKRILRNRGIHPIIQLCIIIYVVGISFVYIVVCELCLLKINNDYEFSDSIFSIIYLVVFLLNVNEFTIMPLLFKYCLQKKYYLDFEGVEQQQWFQGDSEE